MRRGEWTDDGLEFGGRVFDPGEVDLLPPASPSKVVCVGLNYRDHAAELGAEAPERPMLFLKPPSSVTGPGAEVELPDAERVEFEAELGVVIGEGCRRVPEEDAMEVVAGFTCVNDVSNRDEQAVERNWVRAKGFDGAAPIGPVVATPDEVPEEAAVELRLNGETRQSSSVDEMIFSVEELVAEVSRFMTLEPGDVISTGTPAGVGALSPGDSVEVEVEGVGVLRHRVAKGR